MMWSGALGSSDFVDATGSGINGPRPLVLALEGLTDFDEAES